MAGCYHDTQEFKSDLNIEVAREGDILQEGQDLDEIVCKKNPKHQGFIPFKDLTLEHLPIEHRNGEKLDRLQKMGRCVVRLVVDKIKNGKQIKEAGSGCVIKMNNKYFITTNNHVVKTEDEVKRCTVEFHYNDDSMSNVFTSRGVSLPYTCPYRDITRFTFHPVPDFLHQLDLIDDKLPDIVITLKTNYIETAEIIPRPGTPKLRFYCARNLNRSLIDLMIISWTDGTIGYIKSFYFKFQPIPSNIQKLTSIDIHIDEDDGKSRVIPGDVVKFGDEFVVKISESIFQDEVKKCRLVWNGEVIGRGTRLYFQRIKTSTFLSGVDLEKALEHGNDNYWIFKCHPIPRDVDDDVPHSHSSCFDNCCIGHPHGGIKMVTFGQMLFTSLERFDNQYRRIDQPGPDCQCKVVTCLSYSCKTCPGSSGSLVILLSTGPKLISGLSHFMGKSAEGFVFQGEQIENINTAWTAIASGES